MFNRLKQMLRKEFLQMLRDPRMRIVLFVMPLVQMMVIAFALTTDVTRVRTVLLDLDNTPASRELTRRFTAGGHFIVTGVAASQQEMTARLDSGEARAALHFPAGFANDLGRGNARIQFLADGTQSIDAGVILGYAEEIISAYLEERTENDFRPMGGIETVTRAWYNPNLESRFYYVPGLIAVMLMLVSILLASISIVREKEMGTIEQVMVTPIRKVEFILGKTIPYLITGTIIMTLMLILARLVFGVRIQGNLFLLYAAAAVFIAGNLGLALLVSVVSRTQQQALLTAFFILMPGVLLSGFMFPIHNMPPTVQIATLFNPMRWFLEILQGIVQKGTGVETLWPPLLNLSLLAASFLLTAMKKFRKTLS